MILTVDTIQQTIREKIPANLVVAEHTESGHFYRHTPTNQLFASVTTKCGILDSPHLKKWAARLAVEHVLKNVTHDMVNGDELAQEELKKAAILVHQDQFEEAGDVGTRAHKVIEEYLLEWMTTRRRPADIKSFIRESDSRVFAAARSAELFCKEWYVVPIASEMFVASAKHRFAGTLDSLMMVGRVTDKGNGTCDRQELIFEGVKKEHNFGNRSTTDPNKLICMDCGRKMELEFSMVDFKTSNSIDKIEYAMQVSAYAKAFKEMTGLAIRNLYILRLDKAQAKYELRKVVNPAKAFRSFIHLAHVYDWLVDGNDKLITATPKERVSLNALQLT